MGRDTNGGLSRIEKGFIDEKSQRNIDSSQTTSDLGNVLEQEINPESLQQSHKTMKDLEKILDEKHWGFYELYCNEDISEFHKAHKHLIDSYVNEIANRKYESWDGKITIISPDKKEIIRNSVLDGVRFIKYVRRTSKDNLTFGVLEKAAYYYAYDNDKIKDVNKTETYLIMKAFEAYAKWTLYTEVWLDR